MCGTSHHLVLPHHPGFTPEVYGLGSGLFFLGYALFQIPRWATDSPADRRLLLSTCHVMLIMPCHLHACTTIRPWPATTAIPSTTATQTQPPPPPTTTATACTRSNLALRHFGGPSWLSFIIIVCKCPAQLLHLYLFIYY